MFADSCFPLSVANLDEVDQSRIKRNDTLLVKDRRVKVLERDDEDNEVTCRTLRFRRFPFPFCCCTLGL